MPYPKGYWVRVIPKVRCAKGSHRVKILSKRKRLIVCCPVGPGHWKGGKCKVGTRAKVILTKISKKGRSS